MPLSHAALFAKRPACHGPNDCKSLGQSHLKYECLTHSSDNRANCLPRPRYSERWNEPSLFVIDAPEMVDKVEPLPPPSKTLTLALSLAVSSWSRYGE